MNRWNIPDPALYAMLFGSLSGIAAGMLMLKIGQETTEQDWLRFAGITLAVISLIPLSISGIAAYKKDAGRRRTGMEQIALGLHCISASGAITAIALITEGTHHETGGRLAQAALLLWITTTIIHLAYDKIRACNGNDENRDGYAPGRQTKPEVEQGEQ